MRLRVLGIDPGTRCIGYGLIQFDNQQYRAVDYGFLRTNTNLPFPLKLKDIYEHVSHLMDNLQPEAVAIEEVYVSQNAKTTLRLGHARGVIMLAATEKNIPVTEYAPREIKQAVIGRGGASKDQVKWMMTQMLCLSCDELQEDAADGLAVALCHALRASGIGSKISKMTV